MDALCLPLLFFLHALHPKQSFVTFPILAMSVFDDFRTPWYRNKKWINQLISQYKPPNDQVLILRTEDESVSPSITSFITQWSREKWEAVPYPEGLRNRYGLVLIENQAHPLTDHHLEYIYHLLVRGGKLLIVEKYKVVTAFIKNGEENFMQIDPLLPLNDHDLKVIDHLKSFGVYWPFRILLVGPTPGWIKPLRNNDTSAYGVTNYQKYEPYYQHVKTYHRLPYNSEWFQLVMILIESDRQLLLEADRILMPGGFIAVFPQAIRYEELLISLFYERTGIVFHGMPIWRKKINESA